MCDFETGLTNWFALPSAEHAWANFKLHFDQAYSALCKVRGTTMKNSLFHQQVNSVSETVIAQIKEDNQLVRDELKATEEKMFSVLENMAQAEARDDNEDTRTSDNNSSQINSTTSMEAYFDECFKAPEKKLIVNNKKRKPSDTTINSTSDEVPPKKKKSNRKPFRWNTKYYCWSCGAGNHPGPKCNKKKPGHKSEATFKNMMGGVNPVHTYLLRTDRLLYYVWIVDQIIV